MDYSHTDTIQSDLEALRELAKGMEGLKLQIVQMKRGDTASKKKGSLVTDGELLGTFRSDYDYEYKYDF